MFKVLLRAIGSGFKTSKTKIDDQIETITELVEEDPLKREPRWQRWIPFTFFFGNGKFQPIYFFVTIFCGAAWLMVFFKVVYAYQCLQEGTFNSDTINSVDFATTLGFISSLIYLYKKK